MTLVYHPAVQSDFNAALDYYEAEGARLADRFEAEFKVAIAAVAAAPRQFPFYLRSRTYRRIRLRMLSLRDRLSRACRRHSCDRIENREEASAFRDGAMVSLSGDQLLTVFRFPFLRRVRLFAAISPAA